MPWWNAKDTTKRVSPVIGTHTNQGKNWKLSEKAIRSLEDSWKDDKRKENHRILMRKRNQDSPEILQLSSEQRREVANKLWNSEKGDIVKDKISKQICKLHTEGVYDNVDRSNSGNLSSIRMKTLWKNNSFRDMMERLDHTKNKETKSKISEALKGVKKPLRTSSHCKNLSISINKPETIEKLASQAAKNRSQQAHPNKAEKKLEAILNKLFPDQFKLNVKEGIIIGNKIPDFVDINDKKLVVELFGDYWHGKRITGNDKELEEHNRRSHFDSLGFKTIIIWENELDNEEIIKRKVLYYE